MQATETKIEAIKPKASLSQPAVEYLAARAAFLIREEHLEAEDAFRTALTEWFDQVDHLARELLKNVEWA